MKLEKPSFLKPLLATLYILFALFCIAFALGLFTPLMPLEQVAGQQDSEGNAFSGDYRPYDATFVGTVHIDTELGLSYDGGFEGNRLNGEGSITSQDGWSLKGTFVDGRLEGEGTYTSAAGTYQGNFKDSMPDGIGTFESVHGWTYKGEFSSGQISGKGTFMLADDTSYSGELMRGYAQGTGEVAGPAWSYEGGFTFGYRNGQGVLTFDNGEVLEGTWEAGFLVSE